jgi:hypothetical protein
VSGTWRLAAIEQETDQRTILDIPSRIDLEFGGQWFWPENSVLNRSGSFASFREWSFLVPSCYRYRFNRCFRRNGRGWPYAWTPSAVAPESDDVAVLQSVEGVPVSDGAGKHSVACSAGLGVPLFSLQHCDGRVSPSQIFNPA